MTSRQDGDVESSADVIAMVSFERFDSSTPSDDWDDGEDDETLHSAHCWDTLPAQNGVSTGLRQNTIRSLPSRCLRRATKSKQPGPYTQIESYLLLNDCDSSTPSSHAGSQNFHGLEQDPLAKQIDALRDNLDFLSRKRQVKAHLVRTESQRSKGRPISFFKHTQYKLSMSVQRMRQSLRNVLSILELWYSSLKTIEGHFGSGVASYFKFLRWLFIHNCIVLVISGFFLITPQLLYHFLLWEKNSNLASFARSVNRTIIVNGEGYPPFGNNEDFNESATPKPSLSSVFTVSDLLTGDGFLTNTSLYYGFYTNESLVLVEGVNYHIPSAYFFTFLICFLISLISLSTSMARSYRKSFIETSDGLNNVYALKIFCSWDFSIATEEAASLSAKQIYHELKELVDEWRYRENVPPCIQRFTTLVVQLSLNVIFILLLTGTAMLLWDLLGGQSKYLRGQGLRQQESANNALIIPSVVSIIMLTYPMLFSYVVKYEGYRSPRTALYVTLLRTFVLELVVVGVLVSFWLKTSTACWETSLGQEVYRLVLADFIFSLIGTSFAELLRSILDRVEHLRSIYSPPKITVQQHDLFMEMPAPGAPGGSKNRKFYSKLGQPEFDIARNTLNLIYNQTLFWVGFYFSPLLALIIVVKLFLTFYIKKFGALCNCKCSPQSWRIAQTHTLYLSLTFLSLIGVIVMYGYVITQVPASQCGPFQGYPFMYQMILEGILNLRPGSQISNIIIFLTRPGFVAGLLIAMAAAVYYLRAQSRAHRKMVEILRPMLISEARDKEFLLRYFDKIETYYGKGTIPRSRVSKEENGVSEHLTDAMQVSHGRDRGAVILNEDEFVGDTPGFVAQGNGCYISPNLEGTMQSEDLLLLKTASESSIRMFDDLSKSRRR